MPRFAANLSMLFTEVDFLDRFAAAAEAGFTGVEYLFPYDYPAEEIKARLDANQLTQVLFNLPAGDWAGGERGITILPERAEEFRAGVDQAIAYANRRLTKCHFWIMGPTDEDPEYYEECLAYRDFLKLDNVTFTGYVNLREYLGKMDLLILTSISEGQPLAILEGMACSLPFVTTNVGDCETFIKGDCDRFGPAGTIAPVMDYAAIGDGIIELCRNPRLRRQLGENGYQRIRHSYSAEAFITGYKELYQQSMGGEGPWQESGLS